MSKICLSVALNRTEGSIVSCVASCVASQTSISGGVFYVEFRSYSNVDGTVASGKCCDAIGDRCHEDGCDYQFEVCVDEYEGYVLKTSIIFRGECWSFLKGRRFNLLLHAKKPLQL